MINTQYINLNMTPSGVMPVLYVSQYDVGRPLGMVVYNGGEAVALDSYTCTIEATRTDGTAITAAVTTEDNIGAFVTTATMTNQADKYMAKLVLFDSNSRRVASLAFIMCVTPKTMDENAESIEEDKSLYQQYTGTVQTLIADIRENITDLKKDLDTLVDELALPLYHPETYITFDNLMDLSVSETYALFDAYVNEGLLTKVTAGYASSSASGTQATEDRSKPIYLYRYRNPMMGAEGYTTGSYARPILLSSAMHGNEKMGTVIMLTMIEDFKAGKNPQIKHLFDDFGIDFIPVLNPYGYDQSIGTTMETVEQNIGRWNARGVDLNRNGVTCWASSEDTDKGAASLSECESRIIHGLATTNGSNYAFYADIHTERYTESEHNDFGTISSGGGTLRAIFSIVMSNMDKRMKDVYGYDMVTELNGLSITGILNRLPMAFIDRCYALDSYTYGVLYEAPRYNDGILYPIKSQKFTCDIFINFLMNMMEFIKRYRPLYNSVNRNYIRGKVMQGDILPTDKSGWEYGVVVNDIEYSSLVAIRTVDKIDVRPEAYYDIITSYDMLYYSLDFTNDSGATRYINWTNTKQRIYTGTFTKVRVNVRLGDPSSNKNYVINMPSFMHDWDIIMKPAGIYVEDIKSSLSSNYGVIDYAIAQKNGKMVSVAFRMRLTANVPALTYFLTGLPLAVSNYTGLNNVRVYDLRAELCMDCLVNHPDGATVSSLQCLEALDSGHGIRGTITYFTMM